MDGIGAAHDGRAIAIVVLIDIPRGSVGGDVEVLGNLAFLQLGLWREAD